MLMNLHRSRSLRAAAVLATTAAALAVPVSASLAQQRLDEHGLAFSAEVGKTGHPSHFTLLSARPLRRVDLRIVEGAKVLAVRRTAGTRVGTLTFLSGAKPILLTIARTAPRGRMVIGHRGALQVVFTPSAKTVLSITGLPARNSGLELDLNGGKAQLLTSQSCRDEQNFRVTVWRTGARRPVQDTGGVTC